MNCTIHIDAEFLSDRKSELFLRQTECSFACSLCVNKSWEPTEKVQIPVYYGLYWFVWTVEELFIVAENQSIIHGYQ